VRRELELAFVNIVTSDRGWILEQLAEQLRGRLPYIRFGNGADPSADILYYMTYSSRRRRISPVEVGYFAHLEAEGLAHDNFFRQAEEVDYCICHAKLYEQIIRDHGVENVAAISPGVDLDRFSPKLRIGIVGRTYHTGRKGEHLISQLGDIPEIEWSFTGEGWPGPALSLPASMMSDFYQKLDYVLVPALYEGGPMCVVEALASGTPVVAPAVGWVPEFPHVEFEVGDVESLRSVLLGLIEEKRARRATVLDRTWDNWAEGHDRVFQQLSRERGWSLSAPAGTGFVRQPSRVGLILHGTEGKSPGGPTVRVPRLAQELRDFGTDVQLVRHPAGAMADFDVAHVFNAWAPTSALDAIRKSTQAKVPTVFSPIFMDLSLRDLWQKELPEIFERSMGERQLAAELISFEEMVQKRRVSGTKVEPEPGYYTAVRAMLRLSDAAIFLSERERDRLSAIGADVSRGTVVHNPVDSALYGDADPQLFIDEYGLKDFVLCVARQESRKNQLMLMHALADTGIPLVLIGHMASAEYVALMDRYKTDNVHIIGRLPPNSPMLASAYAASRVATLPSWSEGAPLSALEAAAAGASLVLSDASGESEYFGDLARYLDPASVLSIRNEILTAYETRRDAGAVEAQRALIAERFGWDRHRECTSNVYRSIFTARSSAAESPIIDGSPFDPIDIVFDVTTSANHKGRWTGIARLEMALALALREDPGVASIRFVAWNDSARTFVEIPFAAVRAGAARVMVEHSGNSVTASALRLPVGARYIVAGSGWMQNQRYAEALVTFKNRHDLKLCTIIADIIPTKFSFWFDDGYAEVFERNLKTLLGNTDTLLAISEHTKKDIVAFSDRTMGLFIPPVYPFRIGDEIAQIPTTGDIPFELEHLADRSFILAVGAIHIRKNYKLLYDVWVQLHERMREKCPALVIVGGVAWNGEDLARAFRKDKRISDQVLVLEGIDDDALSWLYQNCRFTVYPSLYEGWGLPVSESLRYGKLCIASNSSSISEIAPDLVEHIDPLDTARWLAVIQHYAQSKRAREARELRIRETYRATTWSDSARSVVALLGRPMGRIEERAYVNGAVVTLGDRDIGVAVKRGGWHLTERWGCWSNDLEARLSLTLAERFTADVILVVEVNTVQYKSGDLKVEVSVNDVPLTIWTLANNGSVRYARIPAALVAERDILDIVFRNSKLVSIAAVKGSKDERVVGIGVGKFAVVNAASVPNSAQYLGVPTVGGGQVHLGRSYNLVEPGANHLLQGKWERNSAWGAYSTGASRLNLFVQDNGPLQIELTMRTVASPTVPLSLIVLVNGEETISADFTDDNLHTIVIPVPCELLSSDTLTVDLLAGQTRGPSDLGLGAAKLPNNFGLRRLRVARAGEIEAALPIPYQAGRQFLFGIMPSREAPRLPSEWHAIEDDGVWSMAARATIPFILAEPSAGALLLVAKIQPFAAPEESVNAQFFVNDQYIGGAVLTADGEVRLPIPATYAAGVSLFNVGFAVAAINSPYQRKVNSDERQLGLRLSSITMMPIAHLPRNAVLSFGAGANSKLDKAFLRGGWYDTEEKGRWTHADQGRISLYLDEESAGVRLFFVVRVVDATEASPVVADILVDGIIVDVWVFYDPTWHFAELENFLEARGRASSVEVMLRPRACNSSCAETGDPRQLGMMVSAIVAADDTDDGLDASQRASGLLLEAGAAFVAVVEHIDPEASISEVKAEWVAVSAVGVDSNIEAVLREGWLAPEASGVWALDPEAVIDISHVDPEQDRLVKLRLRVFGSEATGAAEVRIGTPDGQQHAFFLGDDNFQTVAVQVRGASGALLTVRRVAPISPEMMGVAADSRLLGVMLQSVVISIPEPGGDIEPLEEGECAGNLFLDSSLSADTGTSDGESAREIVGEIDRFSPSSLSPAPIYEEIRRTELPDGLTEMS
jgi:glycosyltransferase involved in cell wall biosynthesis